MVRREDHDDVVRLTLAREERRNALDTDLCDALRAAVDGAVADGARALVITGSGPTFCAGADFSEVYRPEFRDALYSALAAIRDASAPVIAAVNGPAIGAGTQLAIACDLRVGAREAVFSIPTARIGLAVDSWTIRRLAALIGAGAAGSVLLGCEQLDVDAAVELGLVNRIGDLALAEHWATELASLAPLTLAYSKLVLHDLAVGTAGPAIVDAFERCWSSEDVRAGELARHENRPPRFRGG